MPETPAPAVPRPGDVLGGKYRIEREIGSGGMGVVYAVTHLVMTERRFAVKWLRQLNEGPGATRRFVREAQIAGRIRHPNVVEVYDINVEEDGCYLVMDLLEGESLDARLKREGRLSVREACRILLDSASGVAAAHAVGVVHRDLKPANIFLCFDAKDSQVRAKVLDFGISRIMVTSQSSDTTETRKGSVIGTPSYMAPEQLRGDPSDNRTDVYALGVTLYEALSGKRAFEAPSYPDLMARIISGGVAALPELPRGLSQVVARAMHRLPEARYASMEELAAALQPYVSGAGPAKRRRPWVGALVGAGLGLAAVSFAWLERARVSQPSAAPQTETARSASVDPPAPTPLPEPEPARAEIEPARAAPDPARAAPARAEIEAARSAVDSAGVAPARPSAELPQPASGLAGAGARATDRRRARASKAAVQTARVPDAPPAAAAPPETGTTRAEELRIAPPAPEPPAQVKPQPRLESF